ncbi:LptF/LptG family permease, partial [Escherichia sp. TWPC-MK]
SGVRLVFQVPLTVCEPVICFGFVFYVLDQIFGPLTLVYGIPPIIGALLPSASFFLISLWLLMRKS